MSISIFSFYPIDLFEKGFYSSIDEALSETRKLGIKTAEAFTFEFEKYPFKEYASFLKRNDLSLKTVIITSPFAICDDSNYVKEIDNIKKIAEDAEKEGAEFIMVVPDADVETKSKEKTLETMIKGLSEITEYTKNSSLTTTIENFSLESHPYSTIEELQYIFKNVPDLKLTFDAANFYCVKNDPVKAYETLKEHIIHAHGKDWLEDETGGIVRPGLPVLDGCPVGDGILPLEEIIARFKNDGYRGQFVIEINSDKVIPDWISKSAEFLRRNIDA